MQTTLQKMLKFKRVYHPWDQWEEVKHGMWTEVADRKLFLEKAIAFTSDHALYGSYMLRVVQEWPVSCENALTDQALSRRAWVGHAACALAFQCPEDIVRLAWKELTDEQQFLANKAATRAIQAWEDAYSAGGDLSEYVGEPVLSLWDSG